MFTSTFQYRTIVGAGLRTLKNAGNHYTDSTDPSWYPLISGLSPSNDASR